MKYLFIWDIFGKIWRETIKQNLQKYKEKYSIDFVFANTENISHWSWTIPKHLDEMAEAWVDFFTWWNHTFKNKEILKEFKSENCRQIRPCNYPNSVDWEWYILINDKILLINVMWNTFMWTSLTCPFKSVSDILEKFKDKNLDIFVDIHAEASSEKKALAYFLDWKISWIVWTHTHIQTNDEQILQKWTWYITDIWMTWAMESILWVKKEIIINKFLTQVWTKFEPEEEWKREFCAVYFEIIDWKCIKIEKIKEVY